MTIQKAAYEILKEKGHPLASKEIAQIALERGLVVSRAKDPILSLAQTIDKYIRDETYNVPRLCFMRDENGRRVIGLPDWVGKRDGAPQPTLMKTVEISAGTYGTVLLAQVAGIGNNETETIDRLIREGFQVLRSEIMSRLANKVKQA